MGAAEALAGRSDVTVSIPYEPGRAAFASLRRTMDDLAALADGRIDELPPRFDQVAAPALAHLERTLFAEALPEAPPIDGALRFFESAGKRGALELVGEELLSLLRSGVEPEQIGLICPSLERWQAPLETAFGTLGVPYALEAYVRFDRTAFGQALLSLLRFAWLGGGRADLYAFLRSPYSGLTRQNVDFLEGACAGAPCRRRSAWRRRRCASATASRCRSSRLYAASRHRSTRCRPRTAMLRAAYGLDAPPVADRRDRTSRAHESVERLVAELGGGSSSTARCPLRNVRRRARACEGPRSLAGRSRAASR